VLVSWSRVYSRQGVDIQSILDLEGQSKAVLEGAGDGVWDWDVPTNKVFFSRQWKAMLSFTEYEIGNSLDEWQKRLHPDDRDYVHAELQKHFDGQTPVYVSEHRMLGKDGSYKWILDRGKVISRDKDGKPLRVIGTHSDITARKNMEQELKSSEGKLRTIIESTPQGITVTDLKGKILEANSATCRFMATATGRSCWG
jgi:PAS domain S-box-containing protein